MMESYELYGAGTEFVCDGKVMSYGAGTEFVSWQIYESYGAGIGFVCNKDSCIMMAKL